LELIFFSKINILLTLIGSSKKKAINGDPKKRHQCGATEHPFHHNLPLDQGCLRCLLTCDKASCAGIGRVRIFQGTGY
jgi:hypothetical protein